MRGRLDSTTLVLLLSYSVTLLFYRIFLRKYLREKTLALAFVQVRLPLTIPSTAQKGARTLFVENANKEKSAASGAIEIK